MRGGVSLPILPALLSAAACVLSGAQQCAANPPNRDDRSRDAAQPAPEAQLSVVTIGDPRFKHWEAAAVVGFSADGQTLLSVSRDRTARFWDVTTGRSRDFTFDSRPAAALAANGRTVFLADRAGVRQVDVESGREQKRIGPALNAAPQIAATPDGRRLAILTGDDTTSKIVIWDLTGDRAIQTISLGEERWGRVAISPDGRTVVGCFESSVVVFDVETGKVTDELVHRDQAGNAGVVYGLAFSPDGRRLATGAADGAARVWNIANGQGEIGLKLLGTVSDVAWSRDGRVFATAGDEVGVWDAKDGSRRWVRNLSAWSVAFSQDGLKLAVSTGQTVLVLDAATGRNTDPVPESPDADYMSLSFHPDGPLLTGNDEGEIEVWDPQTGQRLDVWHAHDADIARVVTSADGKLVATAAVNGEIRLWDAGTKRERHSLDGPPFRMLQSIALSPDGGMFAWRSMSGAVELVDLATLRHVASLTTPRVRVRGEIVFAPGGRRLLAAGSSNILTVWDTQRYAVESLLGGKNKAHEENPAAISPDGTFAAGAGRGNGIPVWELATGKQTLLQGGHEGFLLGLAFSPDGRLLASSAQDGTVQLWDFRAAKQLHRLKLGPPGGTIRDVAFSPDGRRLATLNGNGTVSIVELGGRAAE